MPLAVSRRQERSELKTVDGGYVVIRRLSNGEANERRSLNSKMQMQASKSKDIKTEFSTFSEAQELYSFAKAVVEHNLTYLADPNDELTETSLDFKNPQHVRMLDAIVAEEIATLIDRMNNFDDDEEVTKSSV